MRILPTTRAIALICTALVACSSPTEVHGDIDRARAAWLQNTPLDYTFEISSRSSWSSIGEKPFESVRVVNGHVVGWKDAAGNPVQIFGGSIADIWDRILEYRAKGWLNAASFDRQGVPVEVNMGPWINDDGMHHRIRNFVRQR